ncbi:MAG: polysaccharide biosynthesis/export family protein [Deltaproteobacteria bacterium]|nr:polysaccharide biosynthesis/export family protein [Deltaproteobacteria bacterium]
MWRLQSLAQAGRTAEVDYRGYQVGPEDLLEVRVFGQDNLNRQVRVNGQGTISLPLVGEVAVAGLTPREIENRLVQAYGSEYLRHPQISVRVKEHRHQRVAVTGAVDRPGQYEMIGPRTLLEMLALAGGLQDKPGAQAGDKVHIIRRRPVTKAESRRSYRTETIVIDLRRLLQAGNPELNIPIHHGDVIFVPFAGHAYVMGGVRRPGAVPVKDNLTLTQAVALAGGLDPVLATPQVEVLRLDENGTARTFRRNLNKVMAREETDIPLKDNDVVVVGESRLRKALFVFKELLPGAMSGAYRFAPN